MPKIPSVNRVDTNTMRQITNGLSMASPGGRGARFITSGSVGSNASTMPSATELTMFTHKICTGMMGKARPSSTAASSDMDSPPLMGSRKVTVLRRLS